MHSSTMHTLRCSGRLLAGCLPSRGLPGVSDQGGVCPGGCQPREGLSAHGVSARGVYAQRSVCLEGCLPDTHPVNRITDRCKNITLPELHCGR